MPRIVDHDQRRCEICDALLDVVAGWGARWSLLEVLQTAVDGRLE